MPHPVAAESSCLLADTEMSESCQRLADPMDDIDTDQALESLREIAGKLSIPLPGSS